MDVVKILKCFRKKMTAKLVGVGVFSVGCNSFYFLLLPVCLTIDRLTETF